MWCASLPHSKASAVGILRSHLVLHDSEHWSCVGNVLHVANSALQNKAAFWEVNCVYMGETPLFIIEKPLALTFIFTTWALSAVETPTSSTDLPSLYMYLYFVFVADSNRVARLTSLKMAQDRRKQLLSFKYNQR